MNRKYIFKDRNFVKCLINGWAKDKNWKKINLEFKETENGWELVLPQEVIDSVTFIGCSSLWIEDISGVWNFENLKDLILVANNISGLPSEIGLLENLESLILVQNPLSSLPTEITNLKKLKSLYLPDNSELWDLNRVFSADPDNGYLLEKYSA